MNVHFIYFISGQFHEAVSVSDYLASNGRIISE
jgi:hypothetical protein